MEKICEFCAALRPTVFCKADSAFLCLSCDAKVHSANALSNRHFRCLVCESCRGHPAYIRCLRHRLLLCTACDATLHHNNAKLKQHQRRMVSSFTGSPSAKQFAILWGFDVNQLPLQEQLSGPSTSSISAGSVVSHREEHKMEGNDGQQSCLIMQQILELNKLQLNGGNNPSSAIRGRGQAHSSSSCVYNTMGRIDECLEDTMMGDSSGPSDDLQALKDHHFLPPPLSQSEYFSSYTSTALESNQFWTQNLEEPRVSEELNGFDVFKMPEVDMTFPNFEELLRGNQDLSRALLQDNESENSDAHSAHATENQDCWKTINMESETKIRPSYTYSFSISDLSAESSGSDCYDNGHPGDLARADLSLNPSQLQAANIEGTKDINKSRLHAKKTQLAQRKSKAEPNRHGMKATRSC